MKVSSCVNNKVLKIDKSLEKKEKLTVFNVTINTNRSNTYDFSDNMEKIENQFKLLINYLYSSDNAPKLLKCNCHARTRSNPNPPPCKCTRQEFLNKVKDLNLKTSVEYGPKINLLHSHTLVRIVHNTKVLINIDRVRKIANAYMQKVDPKINCYVDVSYIKSDLYDAVKYVSHSKETVEI